ncbi:Calx-beta domain-containing protein [Reyranella sp.]|uniref:Calx-beta domain-containing protein n=1 Tax=Reyranella sp. TaxID=1929291 RepID=UPI003D1084BF
MAVSYTDLLRGAGRWHDGTGTITYSFPTKVPNYFNLVDYDGKAGVDAVQINDYNNVNIVDELVPIGGDIGLNAAQQAAAIYAVDAWNEVARINAVRIGGGGGGGGSGTPIVGNDGTLVDGLGGASGLGENLLARGDDGPSLEVSIDSVFANGLNFFGTTYHNLWININGSVSFRNGVSSYTPTTITAGGTPLIAPFWADVDTRLDTTEPIQNPPQIVYDLDTANKIFTVTWPGVDYFSVTSGGHVPKANFFQLQLYDRGGGDSKSGNDFDIVFRYQSMQWTTGNASGGTNGLGGTAAHAGWTAGDGKNFEEVPASGIESALLNLPTTPGNTDKRGMWVYEVRNGAVVGSDIVFGAYSAFSTDGTDGNGLAGLAPSGKAGAPVLADYPGAVAQKSLYGQMSQDPLGATIGTRSPHGDVFFNNNLGTLITNPQLGDDGFETFLHEYGHSIGLDHPGGDGNNPQYNDQYTVMSYNRHPSQVGIPTANALFPITPMVLDIEAAQELYGANLNTRTENNTYFGPAEPGTTQVYPFANGAMVILSIWDAGGIDTISGANQFTPVFINLNPGSYSTVGGIFENVGIAALWTDPNTQLQYGWIENAIGGFFSDSLRGNDLANVLDGGQSSDVMIGQKGDDTYKVDDALDFVDELLDEGIDQVFSSVSHTLAVNVENLTLTETDPINGTGNDLANIIVGNVAANRLDGMTGADSLEGGDGADTYVVDNPGDVVVYATEKARPDIDTVETSITLILPGSKLLDIGFIENLTLTGNAPINGYGNDFDNTIIGNDANNILDGIQGADKMFGKAGNDVYGVDEAGDVVVENPNEGTDTVVPGIDYTLGANVENLSLTRSAVSGAGNELNNVMFGQFDSNMANILNGLAGLDTLRGFGGDDSYFVDIAEDIIIEDAPGAIVDGAVVTGGGFDTVFSTANYKLSAFLEALNLIGPTAIVGIGNDAINVIAGNDLDNIIDGGGDADEMSGGKGNDSYVVDQAGDKIMEIAGQGADSVYSYIDYTLADALENLQLFGIADISGMGNAGANVIIGNAGKNLLTGGGGDDYLVGNDGDDVFRGGAGNDIMDGGAGNDTVDYSAVAVSMTVDLTNGTAIGEGIDLLIGIESAIGSAASDLLRRDTGEGTLDGRGGDDIVMAGGGGGQLLGGSGFDTLSFGLAKSGVALSLELGTATVDGRTAKVSGFETAIGSAFDDVLTGHVDGERLEGGLGNDTIDGRGGDDTIGGGDGNDLLTGGLGDDLFIQSGGGIDTITDLVAGQGTADRVRLTTFATFADVLLATKQVGLDSEIDLGGGNKLVLAKVDVTKLHADDFNLPVGNLIIGTAGTDLIDGGTSPAGQPKASANSDVVRGNGGNDTVKSLGGDDLVDGGDGDDTLEAGDGDDSVLGGSGDDTLVGTADGGNDSYDGGANTDTVSYASVAVGLLIDLSTGSASAVGPQIGIDTLLNIENAVGGSKDNAMYGNAGANRMEGSAGNDTLDGRAGPDTLVSGLGTDTIVFATGYGADVVTDFTPGTDKVNLSRVASLTDLAAVLAKASQVGKDTVIDLGNGDTLTLQNVDKASLTARDFGFASKSPTTVSITPLAADKNEGKSSTTSFTFTVTRTGDTTGSSTVNWLIGNGGNGGAGIADKNDFVGGALPGGTVVFAAGQISQVIDVGVAGDVDYEAVESFTVTLSDAIAATIDSSQGSASGLIGNDDGPAILAIAALDAMHAEGNSGSTAFTFTVTRSERIDVAASATWEMSGSGSAPADAADFGGMLATGSVSFAAGETSTTVTVDVSGDTTAEADEGFVVTLTNPSASAVIGAASATGTILNEDASVSIDGQPLSQAEGHSGTRTFTFTVTLSGDKSVSRSVDWAVAGVVPGGGGNPANVGDFAGHILPAGTLTFGVGETTKTITIETNGDVARESNEGFAVTLSNPSAGLGIDVATADVTIVNDDATATLEALAAVRPEGNSGSTSFTFAVTRAGDTTVAHSVAWAVTGSGTDPANGSDFTGAVLSSGTVSFAVGETSTVVTVNVAGDTAVELDETFTVSLSNPSASLTIDGFPVTGTVLNDDAVVTITASSATRPEGNSGTTGFTFTLTRIGDLSVAHSVSYAVAGSGASGAAASDFAGGTLPGGSVTFAVGESSKTLTVNVSGDTTVETDEGFTVTLTTPSAGLVLGTATAIGTIQADDIAAHDDAYTLHQGPSLVVAAATGVLANDQAATSASVVATTAHGALQLSANGGFNYTPQGGFSGIDSFTYHASGVGGGGENAEAVIYVVPVQSSGTSTTLNLLALTAEQQIASTYITFFGRAADAGGFEFWVGEFVQNLPAQGAAALFSNIASSFGISDEARALYPFLANPFGASDSQIEAFIDSVYDNLFNRSSDQAGLDYWTGQVKGALQAGQFVGSVLINIMSGAQDTAAGQDITTLMGKVAVSLAYVQEQQEHNTMWLGASDIAAATSLLDPVGADPASVLTGIRNAETLIANHP